MKAYSFLCTVFADALDAEVIEDTMRQAVVDGLTNLVGIIGVSSSLLDSYKQDLERYALVSGSTINTSLYNTIDTTLSTTVELDLAFIQSGNPTLKDLRLPNIGRPSLIAVRSGDLGSGVGSPVAGIDVMGRQYNISFASIQDSVRGNYANAITNQTGSGAISPGQVISQSSSSIANIESIIDR